MEFKYICVITNIYGNVNSVRGRDDEKFIYYT